MVTYDLINNKVNDISFYLGMEEYLISKDLNKEIFFLWDIDKSIIIGKHQLLEREVNVDYAKSLGCKIFRRPSGGGAIFADEGCFMFTFISKIRSKDEIFKTFLGKMMNALKILGLDIYFSGRNDLMFLGKKFSGNAVYYLNGYSIIHGTFMYDTNISDLVKCCTPNDEKLISKGIKSVQERVINLKPYLNLSKLELMNYLNSEMGDEFKYLDDNDILNILNIKKNFDDENYLYGNQPPYTFMNKKRFSCGEIELHIDINKGRIKSIYFFGDFFWEQEFDKIFVLFKNVLYDKISIENVLNENNININDFINGFTNDDLIKLMIGESYG